MIVGAVGIGFIVLVLAALVGYRSAYSDEIYPGVSVGGVPVGGMTPSQAQKVLQDRLAASIQTPIDVVSGDRHWLLSRQSLGAHYDVAGLAQSAFRIGRSGGALQQLIAPATLRFRSRNLDATIQLSSTDWARTLEPIAQAIDRPAVNARLTVSATNSVDVTPEKSGARLDVDGSERLIASALVSGSAAPIALPVQDIAPTIRATDLSAGRQRAEAVLSGPISISYGGRTWQMSLDDLRAALILPATDSSDKASTVDVDQKALDGFVQRIAAEVNRPGRSAQLTLQDDRVTIVPSETALTVDVAATGSRLQSKLFTSDHALEAVVKETAPGVVEKDLSSSATLANRLIGTPVTVNGPDGLTWSLSTSALRQMLVLPTDPAAQRDQPPRIDSAKLKAFLDGVADKIDRPASNARFQYGNGQVRAIRDGIEGRQVDRGSALSALDRAVHGEDRTVNLPVVTVAPQITAKDAGSLGGLKLIADNTTSYAGSIPPRRHNVELATSLLNGVVVAPGDIFSFNRELGPQTLERGFQVGYGIVAQANGSVKTVPSVGGGICQVSTTLFQPIFWAGYEIEERHWHAYWIAHYASHGYAGLDDTVDDGSGLDFQFKNNTANPILIQSSTDGTHVHFSIYGVPPTWTVHVDPPVITNLVKTDRTLQVQHDPTMPKGQQVYTEAAEDGFTAFVRRTVTDSTGSVRVLNLRSVYEPSHNVVVVGTKGANG